MSALTNTYRHRLTFSVSPKESNYYVEPFSITYALPELAGRKITLSYSPATQADEDVINSFLPAPHADGTPIDPSELPTSLPAYMINLKPELRVDGQVVATGGAITMGSAENVKMTFHDPTRGDDVVSNVIEAGEYWGIAVDPGRMSAGSAAKLSARLDATRAKLTSGDYAGLTKDELLGNLLYSTAMMYFAELDVMDHVQARGMNLRSVRIPSETVFKTSLAVQESFGVPTSASATGLAMDADRILSVDKAMDGDTGLKVRFLQSSGMNSSALEHSVPEQLWSTPGSPAEGVSAVKAIQIAMEQGIPIYTVTRDNIATVMPVLSLDAEVKSAITDAVNAGMEVTVPQTNINFHGNPIVGYIALNPETGAGAYMISGGDSGAWIYTLYIIALTLLITIAAIGIAVAIGLLLWAAVLLAPVIAASVEMIYAATGALAFLGYAKYMNLSPYIREIVAAYLELDDLMPAGADLGKKGAVLTYFVIKMRLLLRAIKESEKSSWFGVKHYLYALKKAISYAT
jgi:hypothetical protein